MQVYPMSILIVAWGYFAFVYLYARASRLHKQRQPHPYISVFK